MHRREVFTYFKNCVMKKKHAWISKFVGTKKLLIPFLKNKCEVALCISSVSIHFSCWSLKKKKHVQNQHLE